MRYVSRPLSPVVFGVVDTDTGKESLVRISDLIMPSFGEKSPIAGVDSEGLVVIPQQAPEYVTPLHAKVKTLGGMEVRVWKDRITHIVIDYNIMPANFRVRLSDFAPIFANGAEIQWLHGYNGDTERKWTRADVEEAKKVIFVLDNKITFEQGVPDIGKMGVIFDLSEMEDCEFVKRIYDVMELNHYTTRQKRNAIIDTPKRFMRHGVF